MKELAESKVICSAGKWRIRTGGGLYLGRDGRYYITATDPVSSNLIYSSKDEAELFLARCRMAWAAGVSPT